MRSYTRPRRSASSCVALQARGGSDSHRGGGAACVGSQPCQAAAPASTAHSTSLLGPPPHHTPAGPTHLAQHLPRVLAHEVALSHAVHRERAPACAQARTAHSTEESAALRQGRRRCAAAVDQATACLRHRWPPSPLPDTRTPAPATRDRPIATRFLRRSRMFMLQQRRAAPSAVGPQPLHTSGSHSRLQLKQGQCVEHAPLHLQPIHLRGFGGRGERGEGLVPAGCLGAGPAARQSGQAWRCCDSAARPWSRARRPCTVGPHLAPQLLPEQAQNFSQ